MQQYHEEKGEKGKQDLYKQFIESYIKDNLTHPVSFSLKAFYNNDRENALKYYNDLSENFRTVIE